MTKEELLAKARLDYPVGTIVISDDGMHHGVYKELYWQTECCISLEYIPAIYDTRTREWIRKKNPNMIVTNYAIC